MPSPASAGPVQPIPIVPTGGAVAAVTPVTANGVMRIATPHAPGPTALTARTSYEHVSWPAGHVVSQVPPVPSATIGALAQAAFDVVQFPSHSRPSYEEIGCPPVATGVPQLTVTVGVPEPRLRFSVDAT